MAYDDLIRADDPVSYWPLAGHAEDVVGAFHGKVDGAPGTALLPNGDAA